MRAWDEGVEMGGRDDSETESVKKKCMTSMGASLTQYITDKEESNNNTKKANKCCTFSKV